jgi:hypothetical protein
VVSALAVQGKGACASKDNAAESAEGDRTDLDRCRMNLATGRGVVYGRPRRGLDAGLDEPSERVP